MSAGKKVINFGAGPAKIPEPVLLEVQKELCNYDNSQMSIMEMSHRSSTYLKLNADAQQNVRDLLNVPANYEILFFQGGGTGMFAAVCLNLLPGTGTTVSADYIVTGSWSEKAAVEAAKYCQVNYVLPEENKVYTSVPDQKTWKLNPNASFVYYCSNETIHGVEFSFIPETHGVPLVCDMSSNIFSRQIDVSKFAVIFAGAQKNIGPSGLVLAIVRNDCLGRALPICPTVLDFNIMAKAKSVYNTPPTFNVYVVAKVFEWIKANGGVEAMEQKAIEKSQLVYDVIRNSQGFYNCPVKADAQSRMNVSFRIGSLQGNDTLEKEFLNEAEKLGLLQLKGHRLTAGIRASLYNAITVEEVKILTKFMVDFYQRHK